MGPHSDIHINQPYYDWSLNNFGGSHHCYPLKDYDLPQSHLYICATSQKVAGSIPDYVIGIFH